MQSTTVSRVQPERFLMQRRQLVRASLAGTAALAAGLQMSASEAAKPGYGIVGQAAPPLHAQNWIDRDGKPTGFSMDNIVGRWTLVKCFQSWCPGCHRHGLPALKKVAERFADHDGVHLVAIQTVFEGFSTNTLDKVRETQLEYKLSMTMGHDAGNPDGDHRPLTMQRYRTGGTPWMIIIDPNGTVVYNEFSLNAEKFIAFLERQLT